MKRRLLIAVPLLCLVAAAAWVFRPKRETQSEAFVSEQVAAVLSGIAQVRQQVGELHYGDRVEVLSKRNEYMKVRTPGGAIGWVEAHQLMEPALWQRSIKLLERVRSMPVQARGRTKVSTNLRVLPGRTEPRLYQFARNVPVEIVGRSVADWLQTSDEKDAGDPHEAKREDWFLVRGIATRPPGDTSSRVAETAATTEPGDQTVPIAGWVIARFIELDLPEPVREGASSANLRPVAWFELNRVADASGDKPQYLLAAAHGPEGQACDFTALRVYTWYTKKGRYETAFVENHLCGQLPIRVAKGPKDEPEFRFRIMNADKEERVYRLMQTIVRRIRESGESPGRRAAARHTRPARR